MIRDSLNDGNIGPHATADDHKISTDVENAISSEAASPFRTRPILIPDTVIVKTAPFKTIPPASPPKELLVVSTRVVLVAKKADAEREGTLVDPGIIGDILAI